MSEPDRIGLRKVLPDLQPPAWMDENIRAMAQQQAGQQPQTTPTPAARKSARSWLPWAGSLVSIGVVMLLVTGQPNREDNTARRPEVASQAEVAKPTEAAKPIEADQSSSAPTPAPNAAPRSAAPTQPETAAVTEAPRVEPPKADAAPTAAGRARQERELEKRRNAPAVSAERARSESKTPQPATAPAQAPAQAQAPAPAPAVGAAPSAPSQAEAATAQAYTSPPAGAAKARAAPENRSLNQSPRKADDASSNRDKAQLGASADLAAPPPDTAASCAEALELLLKATRSDEARRLFRNCSQRFPDHVWPKSLREQLDALAPN